MSKNTRKTVGARGRSRRSSRNPHKNFMGMVQVPQLRVTLPYFAYIGLVESVFVGSGSYYTFAINNVFDPDFSGGGLQPLGFDQYAQFYGRYKVKGFSAEISFASATTSGILVGAYFSPQSTLPAVPLAWPVVNTTSRSMQLATSTGGPSTGVINLQANLADVFGVTPNEYASDMDFAATTSGGPARQAYMHVYIIGKAVLANANVAIKLKYDTEFTQSVALSLS